LVIMASLPGSPARTQEAPRKSVLLVMDIQASRTGLDASLLEGLGDYLAMRLGELGPFQVVPRSLLREVITRRKAESHSDCFDQSCHIELGRELAAERIVSTRLTRVGKQCTLSLGLYDLATAATTQSLTRTGSCGEEAILSMIAAAAIQLAGTDAGSGPPEGMVLIPGGPFWMGCNSNADYECRDDERPGRRVVLDAYYIDKTEVTVRAYSACVRAGACERPHKRRLFKYRGTWDKPLDKSYPVNDVDWHQAKHYCHWAGKRLPTEAEWEKAARGTDGRKYPWGTPGAGCGYAVMDDGGDGCGRDHPAPVCSVNAGSSPFGLCDMAGNLREWVSDWYAPDAYARSDRKNPEGPARGKHKVLRSSDYDDSMLRNLRASRRSHEDPYEANSEYGFRCVREPQ
jgi:formylglycine-generating enzyme required for sulfatase activity